MEQGIFNVFISCKSEDYADAEHIYNWLVKMGQKPFFAPVSLKTSIIHGEPVVFGDEIDDALEEVDDMIVYTSNAEYVKRGYVKDEWRTFVEEQRAGRKSGSLITILNGVNIADLPIRLRSVQSFTPSNYKEGVLRFLGCNANPSKDAVAIVSQDKQKCDLISGILEGLIIHKMTESKLHVISDKNCKYGYADNT